MAALPGLTLAHDVLVGRRDPFRVAPAPARQPPGPRPFGMSGWRLGNQAAHLAVTGACGSGRRFGEAVRSWSPSAWRPGAPVAAGTFALRRRPQARHVRGRPPRRRSRSGRSPRPPAGSSSPCATARTCTCGPWTPTGATAVSSPASPASTSIRPGPRTAAKCCSAPTEAATGPTPPGRGPKGSS
jgi:hypothetical protein